MGGAWEIGALLGQVETPEYSLEGWLLETGNLEWVVLALLGFLLELSMQTGVGLFTEQLDPEGTWWASVCAGPAKRCGGITGWRGRFGAGTATGVALPTLGWKSVIGPGCWMEGAGSWIVEEASPVENRNDYWSIMNGRVPVTAFYKYHFS